MANKTEGHPLYMNYLCRYIAESFDETTQAEKLDEWVENLPAIDGDIRSYYETVWKKANPQGCVFEALALLSQIRGSVVESQLIGMMRNPILLNLKHPQVNFVIYLKRKKRIDMRYAIAHSGFSLQINWHL